MSPEAVSPGPTDSPQNTSQHVADQQTVNNEHPPTPSSEPGTPNLEPQARYPEPPAELLADIRKRLDELPPEVLARAHHALMHDTIDSAGSILYRAGLCLCSGELYEYRKTLFPPGALVDPLTQGPPVLRDRSADSLSASSSASCPSVSPSPCSPCNSFLQHDGMGAVLLSDLRAIMNRYVVLPEMAAEALALWVVHTYAFTLRQVTTYIGVVSPEKRCGKTTLLELLGLLANRSLTAANISSSALFRVIERTQPTLLIDEVDTFLQGRDELAGILNAGYRKANSYVVRVAERKKVGQGVPGEPFTNAHTPEPEFAQWTPDLPQDPIIHSFNNPLIPTNSGATEFARYSCWCPKVMAAIGRLPDTLADRCILITMQRKMPGEKCDRMRQLNAADFRKRCADFVREHSDKIAHAQPQIPSTLNDRAADIWEPLFAIADLAGGEWPQLAREAAQKLSASDDDLTLVGYFLKDLRNLMLIKNVDRMLSRDVISALNPLHDRPWEDLRRGREINEWWLGWQLRQLGIRTKTMRMGEAVGRGYTRDDIEGAFRRYVPNAELHLTQPTAAEHLSGEVGLPKADEARVEAQFNQLMNQLLASLPKEP